MNKISLLLAIVVLLTTSVFADTTQNNTSGSNTSITGGYTNATTYESGSSSSSTTTNNTTSNIRSAPPTSSAPNINAGGMDICAVGVSAGVQTFGLGVSAGKHFRDKNCERIKLARELSNQGMKVAAVSMLCQDERVFQAMHHAGTPCPFEGQIGKKATKAWEKYDKLRPDYDLYVKELKIIEEANAKANAIVIDPVIDNTKK
tara:strand:+ start:386 stop:994 length:609 start_codon:yes stop_codon:yes gene_type:complete